MPRKKHRKNIENVENRLKKPGNERKSYLKDFQRNIENQENIENWENTENSENIENEGNNKNIENEGNIENNKNAENKKNMENAWKNLKYSRNIDETAVAKVAFKV